MRTNLSTLTRRQFLQAAPISAAGLAIAARPGLMTWASSGFAVRHADVDPHALAARAIDAARTAGAVYADVRLSLVRGHGADRSGVLNNVQKTVGVRALVDGSWGFAAGAVWMPDDVTRLAKNAVAFAKASVTATPQEVVLGPVTPVVNGRWTMPVTYDPFEISNNEKLDFFSAAEEYTERIAVGAFAQIRGMYVCEDKVFASTDGSSWEQRTYQASGACRVTYPRSERLGLHEGIADAEFLSVAGKGWEHMCDSGILDELPRLVDEADRSRHEVFVELGQYDVVFSAQAMAAMVEQTIGGATQLDRALGYEANATGTSYLDEPLEMLGREKVGVPSLTVTANRSLPGGVATVRWDDEGMPPDEFTLIKNGVLHDYQTTREQAAWLEPYYRSAGMPVRSRGCAGATSALLPPIQQTPNLTLEPDPQGPGFEQMLAQVGTGYAVVKSDMYMDQQLLNGRGYGTVWKITNGKIAEKVVGATFLIRAPELWKGIAVLGGPASQQWYGHVSPKGDPGQGVAHTVGSVPAIVKRVKFIDATRVM